MNRLPLGLALLLCAGSEEVAGASALYGITTPVNGTLELVEIDPSTGSATSTVTTVSFGTAAVFSNLTYHPPSGSMLALSGGAGVTPELLVFDPFTGASSLTPITGLPAQHPDAGGLEYWDAEDRIMLTAGSSFRENQIAEIDITGAVVSSPVPLGLIDSDFLGESDSGELLSIDYNEALRAAVATVSDPFGVISVVETAIDPPANNNIVGTAVAPTTGELLAVNLVGNVLVRVDTSAFTPIGTIGTAENVLGLEYADLTPTVPGDFDGDGDVDTDDFGVFVASFQNSPQGGPPFAPGDFDEDGDVDTDDFGVFVNSFQMFPPPAVAVPEPAAIALLLVGASLASRRR